MLCILLRFSWKIARKPLCFRWPKKVKPRRSVAFWPLGLHCGPAVQPIVAEGHCARQDCPGYGAKGVGWKWIAAEMELESERFTASKTRGNGFLKPADGPMHFR
jgi:hypothetical protein